MFPTAVEIDHHMYVCGVAIRRLLTTRTAEARRDR